MFDLLKHALFDVLRCPSEPPPPPAGSHGSLQIFRASPSFLSYRLTGLWINLLLFAVFELWAVVTLAVTMGPVGWILAGCILVFTIAKPFVLYVALRLDYEMRYYIITDRSLRIREGVWTIRETTLTFENIQNLKIAQGPLQRLFGIHDLVVETAGGGGPGWRKAENRETDAFHRGVIRGIKRPQELRDLILAYLRDVRTTGLGDADDQAGRNGAPLPAGASGFSAASLSALRGIAVEVGQWRQSLEGAP